MLFKHTVKVVCVLEARNLGDPVDFEVRVEQQGTAYVKLYFTQYLGEGKTGYDVLVYMAENDIEVKHINIHSDHSVGVPKMWEYVQKHFPDVSLTFNPLEFK